MAKNTDARTAWRNLKVVDLVLPSRIEAKLITAGFRTLGPLWATIERDGDWWHRQFPGIGEKTKVAVEMAFAAFWWRHPEYIRKERSQ